VYFTDITRITKWNMPFCSWISFYHASKFLKQNNI